jgi:acyl dehydratase
MIDLAIAAGAELPTQAVSWTERDVALYHLALGVGRGRDDPLDPAVLSFVTPENDPQVLPTFLVMLARLRATAPTAYDYPGASFDARQVVHGHQSVEVFTPLPARGEVELRSNIVDVWDKGQAAVVVQETRGLSPSGQVMFRAASRLFVRGAGGFGGRRGLPITDYCAAVAGDEPDLDVRMATSPQQALLYRLCGDLNPLHSDPGFALAAGFGRPILQGLCTYGMVAYELVRAMLDGQADRLTGLEVSFLGVVYPGETLRLRIWRTRSAELALEVRAQERDRSPVLSGRARIGI